MKKAKIMIESHGVSPWHDYLQNMSWGFSRGSAQDADGISYLDVDGKLEDGGQGLKYVLMADFLNTLSFMSADFLNEVLKNSASAAAVTPLVNNNAEVHGNTGYYYLPYEDEKGLRLDEPDGWIADGENLFLLEARGFRSPGVFNPGQLAKQYLIARSVAEKTGHKNFYILLIAGDFKNIYKSEKNKYSFSDDYEKEFSDLWNANVNDLDSAAGEKLSEKMGVTDWRNSFAGENIASHFLWITWEQIREIAVSRKGDPKAGQIAIAIDFHRGVANEMPIFSKLLFSIAARQEPLYYFYNGGCGNTAVMKYEKMFLTAIGESNSLRAERWNSWHNLANHHREIVEKITALEEARRKAIAAGNDGADDLKNVQKQIKEFYKSNIDGLSPRNTTRKVFELVGESSQLEDYSEFFAPRNKVEKIEPEQPKSTSALPDHSGEISFEEKFDLVQAKLDELLKDACLGEYAVSIKLEKSAGGDYGCYIESEIESAFGENERKACKFVRKEPISADEFSMDEFPKELQNELCSDDYLYENPNIIDSDVWANNWSRCLEKIMVRLDLLKYGYEICWDLDEYREEHSEYFDTVEDDWFSDDEDEEEEDDWSSDDEEEEADECDSENEGEKLMKKEEKIPVKETVAEMIKRIAKENNYEDVHLPETDLLGEDVAIVLRYDGLWSAQFSVGNSPAYFAYFDEKGELDYDHTVWCEFDTPEEALEALDEQCKEMKLRNAILISQDQIQGDGYYSESDDEEDADECDSEKENEKEKTEIKKESTSETIKNLWEEMENDLNEKDSWDDLPYKDIVMVKPWTLVVRANLEPESDHETQLDFVREEAVRKEDFDESAIPADLLEIIKKEGVESLYPNMVESSVSGNTLEEAIAKMRQKLRLLDYGYILMDWHYYCNNILDEDNGSWILDDDDDDDDGDDDSTERRKRFEALLDQL